MLSKYISEICLFSTKSKSIHARKLFNPSNNHFSTSNPCVEHTSYPNSTRERMTWPVKNIPHLIPQIAIELNEVTRQAFFGRALGTKFIEQQLTQTKLLDIYRDTKGKVCQYVRLDCYEEVVGQPISLGIFKLPGYQSEVRNAIEDLTLRELSNRVTGLNPNPSVLHVNCAFNPRGYEIVKTLSDRIVPDIDLISEFESRDQMVKNINLQITNSVKKNPAIEILRQYYINKMEKTTNTKLQFLNDASTLLGCIPIPQETVSKLYSHNDKISNTFHKLLNVKNGDMLLFYSEISYDGLVNKLKSNQYKARL